MRKLFLSAALFSLLSYTLGCNNQVETQQPEVKNLQLGQAPFSISVVPTKSSEEPFGRRITMAKEAPRFFYVILSNISKKPQAVFEDWNSWGYQAVSFEIETSDGHKFTVSHKLEPFTRNFPSVFLIPPGEHMVYRISFDDRWEATPSIPMAVQTPIEITIKAIYELRPTPESVQEKVWAGRVESTVYHFKLTHY